MNFTTKIDDKTLVVDLSNINIKDILQYCKSKEQLVLIKKFGLAGNKEMPLQQIGQQYNLTRERVRQIENQALIRFRRLMISNDKYIRIVESAKKILHANGGLLSENDLMEKVIVKENPKLSKQELKLILVSDFNLTYIKRNKLLHKCFYIDPLFENLLNDICEFSLGYFVKHQSAEDWVSFTNKVKNQFTQQQKNIPYLSEENFYENLYGVIRGMSLFDGKIGLNTFSEVNPKTIKAKILYVLRRLNKSLHYQDIVNKIIERFPSKSIKVNTVHNELVKSNDIFVNMGLGIYGLKEWGIEGGIVIDVLIRIMKKMNRPMSLKEITKEITKEKMVSPNTISMNLQKYKTMFKRTEKGYYTYVGK